MKESPVFSKTYDFIRWILPLTIKFPRQHRFVIAEALQQEALRFQGHLIDAVHLQKSAESLAAADSELTKLRTHFRLAHDLLLVSPGQYEHGVKMLVEIGRLLGGWKRKAAS